MATPHGDKPIKILLTGGGTGGHITPLLAIAEELKQLDPTIRVISIGERGSAFAHLTDDSPDIDQTTTIFAGKFRRYYGESFLKHLLDIRTNLLNIRDLMYVLIGFMQSIYVVKRLNPDVVFLKGGFVGVPIGLAAALWRIPIVTHDSDALPGLANRIVGRWAKAHATGMPAEFYAYDPARVVHVGVLVGRQYTHVSESLRQEYRRELHLPQSAEVVFITGGSLGSQRVNKAVVSFVDSLLAERPRLHIVHQVGKNNSMQYQGYSHERLTILEFVEGMHRYSGAADVIVTRAGANTIAEFGIQAKPCVIIPSPFLTGGHQLKNGEYLRSKDAAVIVNESEMVSDPDVLRSEIVTLLEDDNRRGQIAKALSDLTKTDAAQKLAKLLKDTADGSVS